MLVSMGSFQKLPVLDLYFRFGVLKVTSSERIISFSCSNVRNLMTV